MNQVTIKDCFKAVLCLPLLCLLVPLEWIKLRVMTALAKLSYPLYKNPLTSVDQLEQQGLQDTPQPANTSDPAPQEVSAVSISVRGVLELYDLCDDKGIDVSRCVLEKMKPGLLAIQNSPDRRLYSVLKPTRAENLRRIENAMMEMDGIVLQAFLVKAEKLKKELT